MQAQRPLSSIADLRSAMRLEPFSACRRTASGTPGRGLTFDLRGLACCHAPSTSSRRTMRQPAFETGPRDCLPALECSEGASPKWEVLASMLF